MPYLQRRRHTNTSEVLIWKEPMRHSRRIHTSCKIHRCRPACRLRTTIFLLLDQLIILQRRPIFKETCGCNRAKLRRCNRSLYFLNVGLFGLIKAIWVALFRRYRVLSADFSFQFHGWLWAIHLQGHLRHSILHGIRVMGVVCILFSLLSNS